MEEETKEEEKKDEEIAKETEEIPGVKEAKEAVGMVQGVTGKIGSLISNIFGCSSKEKK